MTKDRFYLECGCGSPHDAVVFEREREIEFKKEGWKGIVPPNLCLYFRVYHGTIWRRLKSAWRLLRSGYSEEEVDGCYRFDEQVEQLGAWLLGDILPGAERVTKFSISPIVSDLKESIDLNILRNKTMPWGPDNCTLRERKVSKEWIIDFVRSAYDKQVAMLHDIGIGMIEGEGVKS